jgi:hypothetical protein
MELSTSKLLGRFARTNYAPVLVVDSLVNGKSAVRKFSELSRCCNRHSELPLVNSGDRSVLTGAEGFRNPLAATKNTFSVGDKHCGEYTACLN